MAAIPVTIQGVMIYSDFSVGGGPMPGGPGGQPPQPVYPAHPIAGGPWPSHPIYGPQPPQPGQPPGGGGGGQPPLGIWGGPFDPPRIWGGAPPYVDIGFPGSQPHPEHPIVLPPELPPTMPDPDNRPIDWKTAWTPQTGWIVIGVPSGAHLTPSK
jgi:hypothetical protein